MRGGGARSRANDPPISAPPRVRLDTPSTLLVADQDRRGPRPSLHESRSSQNDLPRLAQQKPRLRNAPVPLQEYPRHRGVLPTRRGRRSWWQGSSTSPGRWIRPGNNAQSAATANREQFGTESSGSDHRFLRLPSPPRGRPVRPPRPDPTRRAACRIAAALPGEGAYRSSAL